MSITNLSELNTYERIRHFLASSPAVSQVVNYQPSEKNLVDRWTLCNWITAPLRYYFAEYAVFCSEIFYWMGMQNESNELKDFSFSCKAGFIEGAPRLPTSIVQKLQNGESRYPWGICQVLTAPFRYPLALIFWLGAGLSSGLGCANLSGRARALSNWFDDGFAGPIQDVSGLRMLNATLNRPNKQGKELNNHGPIPVSDPKLCRRIAKNASEIQFEHRGGICRGMVDWFLYLYLKTRDQFTDPCQHMMAIGELFKEGGGKEAVLLQSLSLKNGKILGLNKNRTKMRIVCEQFIKKHQIPGPPLSDKEIELIALEHIYDHCINGDDLKRCPEEVKTKFQSIGNGGYLLGLNKYGSKSGHAIAWIKFSDRLSCVFDPNLGIYLIDHPDQTEILFKLWSGTLKELKVQKGKRGRLGISHRYTLRS